MAIRWQNSFDGPDGVVVTSANSADYGDAVTQVVGDVRYTTERAAAGTSAALIPHAEDVQGMAISLSDLGMNQWAIRGYLYAPAGGAIGAPLVPGQLGSGSLSGIALRPDIGLFSALGVDIDAPAAALTDTWVRWEIRRAGSSDEPIQVRLWWTRPHSSGEPDWSLNGQFEEAWGLGSLQVTTHADAGPGYLDELVVADTAEWIGPAVEHHEHESAFSATGHYAVQAASSRRPTTTVEAGGAFAADARKRTTASAAPPASAMLDVAPATWRRTSAVFAAHAGLDVQAEADWGHGAQFGTGAGLSADARTARTVSARLGANAGLDVAARKRAPTTATFPAAAGLGVDAEQRETGETSASFGAGAGFGVHARKHATTNTNFPATAGFRARAGEPSEPWPLDVHVEAQLGGQWVDLTRNRPAPEAWLHQPLAITAGRQDEASAAQPAEVSFTLDNPHGDWTPRNPSSEYFGQWQLGTPIRVRVAGLDEDPEPAPILVDTFDRTVTDGWGAADTGQAWTVRSSRPSDFSVTGGTGRITLPTNTAWPEIYSQPLDASDVDITATLAIDPVTGGSGITAAWVTLGARYDPDTLSGYMIGIGFLADGGAGAIVAADITRDDDGATTQIIDGIAIPDLTYEAARPLRVRVRLDGPEIRARVWPDGDREPAAWHIQTHDATYTDGAIGFGVTIANPGNTPAPTVTVHDVDVRPAPVPSPAIRLVGEVASIEPSWPHGDLSSPGYAGEARVQVTAAGVLRRLGQGASPVESAITRTVSTWRPLAYWPCEDNAGATRAAAATPGGAPLLTNGWSYADGDGPPGSKPVPTMGRRANMVAPVPTPTIDTGGWDLNLMYNISESDWPGDGETRVLVAVRTTGTIERWAVLMRGWADERRGWQVLGWDADGGVLVDSEWIYNPESDVLPADGWRWLQFTVAQNGSGVDWSHAVRDITVPAGRVFRWTGTTAGASVGHVTRVDTRGYEMPRGLAIGHVAVFGRPDQFGYQLAARAHAGETVRARMSRLSAQHGVPVEIHGEAATRVGAQQTGTFLELLQDAADVDAGILAETRHQVGLAYRDRRSMYDQTPRLHLDAGAGRVGDIAEPFAPVLDDQAARNDVEIQRTDGSAARAVDTTGPMGVDAIGRYDESTTINAADDVELADHAGWRLHLGTWPGMRYSSVSPALSVRPRLIRGWTRTQLGDRIQVTGLPPQHPTEAVDLLAQGYTETIERDRWDVEINASPGAPWQIGQWHDLDQPTPDARDRYDTPGSRLAAAIDAEQTELTVTTAVPGHGWTTRTWDMPIAITVGGEIMRITAAVDLDETTQRLTVERAVNGIRKAHRVAGADVRLAYPAIVGL